MRGEENDRLMVDVIGENWKEITGANQPAIDSTVCPGFDYSNFMESVKADEAEWWQLPWVAKYAHDTGFEWRGPATPTK